MKKIYLIITSLILSVQPNVFSQDNLSTYFDKNQINKINTYKNEYSKIKTSKDLVQVYKRGNDLSKMINDTLNSRKEIESANVDLNKFKQLSVSIPGFVLGSGAEGMGIYMQPDYKTFINKAVLTPENSDNHFLNLMISVFGDTGNTYPLWFVRTWDYGGYSLLGKGTHIKAMSKIENTLKSSPEFSNEIKEVRLLLIDDIIRAKNFSNSKKEVISELSKFISTYKFSTKEKANLDMKLRDMQINSKNYQFGCETKNCYYS